MSNELANICPLLEDGVVLAGSVVKRLSDLADILRRQDEIGILDDVRRLEQILRAVLDTAA